MRSRSLSRKVGIWPKSFLGKRFIRAKEFLRYLVFVQMTEAFSTTSSSYAKGRLENAQLDAAPGSNLFIEWNSGTTSNVIRNRECVR